MHHQVNYQSARDEDSEVFLMPIKPLEADIQISSNCDAPEEVQIFFFCFWWCVLKDARDQMSESADNRAFGPEIASFQRESGFTTSEILPQRLAGKQG